MTTRQEYIGRLANRVIHHLELNPQMGAQWRKIAYESIDEVYDLGGIFDAMSDRSQAMFLKAVKARLVEWFSMVKRRKAE